jgi:hypothetical protein
VDQDDICGVEADGFVGTEARKIISRVAALRIDAYLGQAEARHSIAV